MDVEHVKVHRTKKEKKDMSHLEKFVTEGNEKADELAKEGAMLDEGFMAEARAKTMQQEREEVYAALQYASSFHCQVTEWKGCDERKPKPKEKWIFVDQKKRGDETSNGVVRGSQQVSMHEVWKKQQVHEENALDQNVCRFFFGGEIGEGAAWEVTIW